MTVREKMNEILQSGNYIDCGVFHIDGREKGILQHTNNPTIKVIYKSKDDIDDNGKPLTKEMTYENLREFLEDYSLTY